MPAQRLGSHPTSVFKYDVVGMDSDAEAEFVSHVGLACEERDDIVSKATIALVHMGPPLAREHGRHPIQACGSADLKVGESHQIGVFVEEHLSEYEAERVRAEQQYIILPHRRESDASCSVRRFNCAGFVIEAYSYAGINLVATNMDSLPAISLETLCQAYPPRMAEFLHNPNRREKFGLEGDGPWPVVLAGYVLNALNRSAEDIRNGPYLPRSGDEYFLPRKNEGGGKEKGAWGRKGDKPNY